nr:hypothetical protein [Bacillota bacterium]
MLVAAGLLWLAVTQGWVRPDWAAIHAVLSRILAWWPLLLVAAGAGILLTRRAGIWLALLALAAAGLAALWFVSAAFTPWPWPAAEGRHAVEIGRPGTAGAARLDIDTTAASLVLTGGAGPGSLAVVESALPGLDARAAGGDGGAARVSIDSALPLGGVVRLDAGTRWDEIRIDGAAVQVRLDLRGVTVGDLQVNAASGRLVGFVGQVTDGARITVRGASVVTELEFPEDVGVEVSVSGRNGRVDLPGFRLVGDRWRSPNWDQAQSRVLVDHRAGVYRLSVRIGR